MIDFSSFPMDIGFTPGPSTATPIKNEKGKVISEGHAKNRMQLIKGSDLYSVAVHSPFSTTLPSLGRIEKLYMVVVKIKKLDDTFGYVKVNANSLRKRLGCTKQEFKEMKKSSAKVGDVLNRIPEFGKSQVEDEEVVSIGNLTLYNGEQYQGEIKEGKPHGKGAWTLPKKPMHAWTSPERTRYVGEFRNGKEEGWGTYTWSDGQKYEGEFKNGEFHGHGTWEGSAGEGKYEGEFREGKFHGQGTFTKPDGRKYVGMFKDDKMDGKGILTWPHGELYEGEAFRHEGVFKGDDPIEGWPNPL